MSVNAQGAAPVPVEPLQVEKAIKMNDSAIDRLGADLDSLHCRLGGLLRDPAPKDEGKGVDDESWVPVAAHLRANSRAVVSACEMIEDILVRLEI